VDQVLLPGISQFSQNAACLISHIVQNPHIFANVVTSYAADPDFDALVQMTIPSLFGYFSSEEQLSKALDFSTQVCQFASPAVCVCILEPFFNSGATWRFLEHSFDRFFRGFFLDLIVTPERERTHLISIHAGNLLQCFTDAIPLLPGSTSSFSGSCGS
jgi:hypothetical protein